MLFLFRRVMHDPLAQRFFGAAGRRSLLRAHQHCRRRRHHPRHESPPVNRPRLRACHNSQTGQLVGEAARSSVALGVQQLAQQNLDFCSAR
jgi:hypothetical protein